MQVGKMPRGPLEPPNVGEGGDATSTPTETPNVDRPDGAATREGLADMVTRRMRRASDVQLVIMIVFGTAAVAFALIRRVPGWYSLASAGVTLGALGGWGIVDRESYDATGGGGWSRTLHLLAGAAGAVAWLGFAVFVFSIVAVAFGRWQS